MEDEPRSVGIVCGTLVEQVPSRLGRVKDDYRLADDRYVNHIS